MNSIKTKSRYFKLYKLGLIDEELNRKYRNCLNSTIRQAKKNNFRAKFESCKNNIKKSWKLIKQLLAQKSKNNTVKSLIVDNNRIEDNSEMAEHFNDYFSSIAHTLYSQLPPTNQAAFHSVTNNLAS